MCGTTPFHLSPVNAPALGTVAPHGPTTWVSPTNSSARRPTPEPLGAVTPRGTRRRRPTARCGANVWALAPHPTGPTARRGRPTAPRRAMANDPRRMVRGRRPAAVRV